MYDENNRVYRVIVNDTLSFEHRMVKPIPINGFDRWLAAMGQTRSSGPSKGQLANTSDRVAINLYDDHLQSDDYALGVPDDHKIATIANVFGEGDVSMVSDPADHFAGKSPLIVEQDFGDYSTHHRYACPTNKHQSDWREARHRLIDKAGMIRHDRRWCAHYAIASSLYQGSDGYEGHVPEHHIYRGMQTIMDRIAPGEVRGN
jgi:hypothetical protein